MSAAQPLRAVAPGGAPDVLEAGAKDVPHLVLVAPPAITADEEPPAGAPRQSFGPRLKAARERQGITLHQIAATTKVSASLLAALERGDVSRWPKGIFRRAFFREYVAAIGLPAEPYLAEFLRLHPDGEHHPAMEAPAGPTEHDTLRLTLAPAPGLSRGRIRGAVIELAFVAAIAATVVWWTGGGASAGAAVVGLCYLQRVIAAARSAVAKWRGGRWRAA